MQMHQVEVDDEVFQFIKGHAEPLIDTFNSTLKRLPALTEMKGPAQTSFRGTGKQPSHSDILPPLPKRVPQALRQTMEVVYLVLSGPYNRSSATHYVARHHNITPQAVIDKYTRQLNSTAGEFDQLLEQPGLADLRRILNSKFPDYRQLIDEITEGCLKESGKAQ